MRRREDSRNCGRRIKEVRKGERCKVKLKKSEYDQDGWNGGKKCEVQRR